MNLTKKIYGYITIHLQFKKPTKSYSFYKIEHICIQTGNLYIKFRKTCEFRHYIKVIN